MAKLKRGRPVGRKNLKRTSRGSIILASGERITIKEQKALKSAVVLANRNRKRILAELPKQAKQRYRDFGVESDFVARKKSASIGRFRSKAEFKTYLRSLQKINSQTASNFYVGVYRKNLKRAIDKTFNSAGKPLKKFVDELSGAELRELSLDESFKDIGYVYYAPVAVEDKLKTLRYQVTIIRKREARTGHKDKAGRT